MSKSFNNNIVLFKKTVGDTEFSASLRCSMYVFPAEGEGGGYGGANSTEFRLTFKEPYGATSGKQKIHFDFPNLCDLQNIYKVLNHAGDCTYSLGQAHSGGSVVRIVFAKKGDRVAFYTLDSTRDNAYDYRIEISPVELRALCHIVKNTSENYVSICVSNAQTMSVSNLVSRQMHMEVLLENFFQEYKSNSIKSNSAKKTDDTTHEAEDVIKELDEINSIKEEDIPTIKDPNDVPEDEAKAMHEETMKKLAEGMSEEEQVEWFGQIILETVGKKEETPVELNLREFENEDIFSIKKPTKQLVQTNTTLSPDSFIGTQLKGDLYNYFNLITKWTMAEHKSKETITCPFEVLLCMIDKEEQDLCRSAPNYYSHQSAALRYFKKYLVAKLKNQPPPNPYEKHMPFPIKITKDKMLYNVLCEFFSAHVFISIVQGKIKQTAKSLIDSKLVKTDVFNDFYNALQFNKAMFAPLFKAMDISSEEELFDIISSRIQEFYDKGYLATVEKEIAALGVEKLTLKSIVEDNAFISTASRMAYKINTDASRTLETEDEVEKHLKEEYNIEYVRINSLQEYYNYMFNAETRQKLDIMYEIAKIMRLDEEKLKIIRSIQDWNNVCKHLVDKAAMDPEKVLSYVKRVMDENPTLTEPSIILTLARKIREEKTVTESRAIDEEEQRRKIDQQFVADLEELYLEKLRREQNGS